MSIRSIRRDDSVKQFIAEDFSIHGGKSYKRKYSYYYM